ncbi:type II toxin-antitoxin system Phd/YefM family antitoxin [Acidicapsa acidisoli]|uniref:type II toxin-antitoxin system Phd/YefM family antitoxin n=1 Tax=Acidicapsa acidisoli TaxID=1615681 RepID=UPI0021DFEF84|nr:type II toxin-antitoxin system Phd/YefM family antitoxin [Acidicapsa acidisoli]
MQTIQASEVEAHFPHILDGIERGETVVITREGKAIAHISSGAGPKAAPDAGPQRKIDPERIQRAKAEIMEIRKRTKPVSLEEILSARDEGRR